MRKNESNDNKKNNVIDLSNYKRDYYNPYSRKRNTYPNSVYPERLSTTNKTTAKNVKETLGEPLKNKQVLRTSQQRKALSKKQRIKLRKRRRKVFLRLCMTVFIGSVVLVWGMIKLIELFTYNKVSEQTVQTGIIDNSVSLGGLIVRYEKVYLSNKQGTLYYIADEGEKVSKGGAICVVADVQEAERIKQEAYQVDHNIYNKQEKREELSYYQNDLYALDQEIIAIAHDYYLDINNNTVQHVITARQKLENAIEKRTSLYTLDKVDTLKENTEKKDRLSKQLNSITAVEKADTAGTVSYIIDGSEEKLSMEHIDDLTYSDFKTLYNDISNSNFLLSDSVIQKNMPIYKLIIKDEWQVITYIDQEKEHLFKEKDKVILNFYENDDLNLNFVLKKKVQEDNKKVKLVFETNEKLTDFLNLRKVNFKIGNRYEGLKIPLQAIVERNLIKIPSDYLIRQNESYGVMRKRNDNIEWVKVSVQYEKDGYTYILQEIGKNSILLNDEVQHPENKKVIKLDSMETHKGVYVINGKVAEFKSINIITQNEEYAIVEPGTTNNGLKAFDKMITNPKNIKEDDLLRYMNIQNE